MKINFCTLFDSNYMTRGMAMYETLLKYNKDFHLYVFAFDDKSCQFLKNRNYDHITVISLSEFENDSLLKAKQDRTPAEYCWTCTPSTIHYSITKFGLTNCTYVDADICFFSDPAVLIEEMGNKSVLITGHRYTKAYDQSATSGKYCVQFLTFRNDEPGMKVLNWWKDACIEWCYNRFEDGKFGDQKYLDDWLTRFESVHDLQHLGGGVAPWNVQQYNFAVENGKLTGTEITTGNKFDMIFFHFHGMKFFTDKMVYLTYTEYDLDKNVIELLFRPYIQLIEKEFQKINKIDHSFDPNGATAVSPMRSMSLKVKIFYYLKDLKRSVKNLFGRNMKYRITHHHYYKIKELLQ